MFELILTLWLDAKMNELIKNIENAVNEAMFQIRDDTVTEVTDNKVEPKGCIQERKLKAKDMTLSLLVNYSKPLGILNSTL